MRLTREQLKAVRLKALGKFSPDVLSDEEYDVLKGKVNPPLFSWIPEDVQRFYAVLNADNRDEETESIFDLVRKLVRSKNMRQVWKILEEKKKSDRDFRHFLGTVSYSYRDSINSDQDFDFGKKSDQKEILEQIKFYASKLAIQINKTPLSKGFQISAKKDFNKYFSDLPKESERFPDFWFFSGSILEFLERLAEYADETAAKPAVLGRPAGDNSKHIYFIRRLLRYFRERYDAPLWEAIQLTTNAVFGTKFSVEKIRNLAGNEYK